MPIIRQLFETRLNPQNPAVPLTSASILDWFGPRQSASGKRVTEGLALTMTAVYRAVSLIAGVSAGLPLKAYRGVPNDPTNRKEVGAPILDMPYPDMTPFVFWETVYTHLLLWGNAYLFKVMDGMGRVTKLVIIDPSRVTVRRVEPSDVNPSGKQFLVDAKDRNDQQVLLSDELMHIPGLGYDGLQGLSPIGMAREAIGVSLAAEETAGRLFSSGNLASGFLHTDKDLRPETAQALGERFKQALGGTGNAHKVAILDRGLKFERLTMPSTEAQFIESRQFQIEEIARLYGVPPHLLMSTGATSNWGTGVAEHGAQWLAFGLNPWLRRVEQAVTMHLTPRGQFAEYTRDALLRTNTLERYQAYEVGIMAGFLSRADVRRYENLPVDDPALEKFMVSEKMTDADKLGEALEPQAPPPGAAPPPTGPALNSLNIHVDARQDPPVVEYHQDPPVVNVNVEPQDPPVVNVDARQEPPVVNVSVDPPPPRTTKVRRDKAGNIIEIEER